MASDARNRFKTAVAPNPQADLILEGMVDFAYETSALIVRNGAGQWAIFPSGENVHRDGILFQSLVPGQVEPSVEIKAHRWAKALAEDLNLMGLLALEFFVLADGSLIFNEMAPRPHNSGHWTMQGCDHSQFDLLIDALTGVPLTPPRQLGPSVMTNLLGKEIEEMRIDTAGPASGDRHDYHDYGKSELLQDAKWGISTRCRWHRRDLNLNP